MPKNLWAAVDKMLASGWPVVLAIGPNNTLIGKKNLTMNSECKNETTRAHYVTITAADSVNIMVSSWGKKYTVSKKEYEDYMKKTSNPLFSNILYIR